MLYVSVPCKESGGSFRSLISLKYLSEFGIEPYVLTYKQYFNYIKKQNLDVDFAGNIDFIKKANALRYTLPAKIAEYLYNCRKCAEKVAKEIIKNYGKKIL